MRRLLVTLTIITSFIWSSPAFAGYSLIQAATQSASANNQVTDNTTEYINPGGAIRSLTTEALRQCPVRTGTGTYDLASVYISANDVSSASTLRFRKNTANGSQALSITGNTTGFFQEVTNSDSVSAGDVFNWALTVPSVSGTHAVEVKNLYARFSAASDTYQRLESFLNSATGGAPSIASGNTRYHGVGGNLSSFFTTEPPTQYTYRTGGTIRSLFWQVSSNSANYAITVSVTINGTPVNNVLSITAATTGLFQDSTNSDSVSVGDLVSVEAVAGTGTGTVDLGGAGIEFQTTNNKSHMYSQSTEEAVSAAATRYYTLSGGFMHNTANAEDEAVQLRVPFASTIKNLQIYLTANAATVLGTFDLRINGASGTNTISVTALTTGLFEDTTHTDTIAINDKVNYRFVVGVGGTSTVSQMGCMIEDTTAAGGTSIKTVNGLAEASLKTKNGLANASTKTFNGLA